MGGLWFSGPKARTAGRGLAEPTSPSFRQWEKSVVGPRGTTLLTSCTAGISAPHPDVPFRVTALGLRAFGLGHFDQTLKPRVGFEDAMWLQACDLPLRQNW